MHCCSVPVEDRNIMCCVLCPYAKIRSSTGRKSKLGYWSVTFSRGPLLCDILLFEYPAVGFSCFAITPLCDILLSS